MITRKTLLMALYIRTKNWRYQWNSYHLLSLVRCLCSLAHFFLFSGNCCRIVIAVIDEPVFDFSMCFVFSGNFRQKCIGTIFVQQILTIYHLVKSIIQDKAKNKWNSNKTMSIYLLYFILLSSFQVRARVQVRNETINIAKKKTINTMRFTSFFSTHRIFRGVSWKGDNDRQFVMQSIFMHVKLFASQHNGKCVCVLARLNENIKQPLQRQRYNAVTELFVYCYHTKVQFLSILQNFKSFIRLVFIFFSGAVAFVSMCRVLVSFFGN